MDSPCKRRKLTPRKQYISDTQETQESNKITSTPQRPSRNSVSPSYSRISSSGSSIRTQLSNVFNKSDREDIFAESTNAESESTNSIANRSCSPVSDRTEQSGILTVENYDTYINESHRIKYVGKVWKLFKPLRDNTLYAEILQNPRNVQEIVTELILLYNQKPENFVCKLLKLCVDVCGFQNFEIEDHYNFQENISKKVIEVMESDEVLARQEILLDTGNYLLNNTKGELVKVLKTSIYNFLQKLIIHSHNRGILYDIFFAKHFFGFIKQMTFSQIRAIRHTGVIFAIKILTAVVKVYMKIIKEENSSSFGSSENLPLQQHKQNINSFLEYFYLIFFKTCRLIDNRMHVMRIECIYELQIWIKYFPKIFINQFQTVNQLLKFLSDPSKEVRLTALEVCESLVESTDLLTVVKNAVPDFGEYIAKRFYDIDIKVAVKAIDIYSLFLKHDESFITTNRFKSIMNLVFDKYFPVGEAACRFLVSFLERTEKNEEIILLQLAQFSLKTNDAVKQLLVEGCLSHCLAIHKWEIYINIFLEDDVELDVKKALVEMFAEAVHQILIGNSTVMREKSRKVLLVDLAEHEKVAKHLPMFCTLLNHYEDHPTILIEFLKIFNIIKDVILNKVPDDTFKSICSVMEKLFDIHNDVMLLNKICETFQYFSNTNKELHVHSLIENISLRYTKEFMTNLSSENEETADIVLKVSVLFKYFNLTGKFKWEFLFDIWGDLDEITIGNLLICCKWHSIWSLKNLKDIENPSSQFPILSRACKEFTSLCFNMLTNLKGQPLHFKTYECLCDLYITYMKYIGELSKSVKKLEKLKLVVDDEQLQNVFISFLDKYVINNTTIPISEQQLLIGKYIELVHCNALPTVCLANIFKYYYVYNKEYGSVIDASLTGYLAADENIFLMIIIYTLTVVYESILSQCNAIDMKSQEAKNLKFLIKQFLSFGGFKSPDKKCTKLIYFSINYVIKDESRYPFLYFLKYFVDLIVQKEDRKEVLDFLKKKVPKAAEKNDAVLFLGNYMKSLKNDTTQKIKPASTSKPKKENVEPKRKLKELRKKKGLKTLGKITNKIQDKKTSGKSKKRRSETETDMSEDDLTIHDSESDDLDEPLMSLKI